jgi:23S rRNA-/tRNA-specific pseudouridylate synthase
MEEPRFLYNDSEIFAVYKPAGLHSVQLPNGGGSSLADVLLSKHPHLSQVARSPGDAGLIHRLDEDTSGIILGAWTKNSWEHLFEELRSGEIQKTYAALVEGSMATPSQITTFIGTPHRGAKKMKVYEKAPPQWARALEGSTVFRDAKHFPDLNASLVSVAASPARRHQVRLHCAHTGHPLVGDSLYGATSTLLESLAKGRSFFLHADSLSLRHPVTAEQITITCPAEHEITLPR